MRRKLAAVALCAAVAGSAFLLGRAHSDVRYLPPRAIITRSGVTMDCRVDIDRLGNVSLSDCNRW